MELKDLDIIDTEHRFKGTVSYSFNHKDPYAKVVLTKRCSTLFISEERIKADGQYVTVGVHTNKPSSKQLEDYVGMQSLISTCANNAEVVKNELVSVVMSISESTEPKRLEVMRMDFMNLKDSFMDYIKKDTALKTIDEYSSNQKLKPFRKSFNTFVLQRNILTHGELHFLHPDLNFVIEYIDSRMGRKMYGNINHELLVEYNNFYKEILKLIKAFRETRKLD